MVTRSEDAAHTAVGEVQRPTVHCTLHYWIVKFSSETWRTEEACLPCFTFPGWLNFLSLHLPWPGLLGGCFPNPSSVILEWSKDLVCFQKQVGCCSKQAVGYTHTHTHPRSWPKNYQSCLTSLGLLPVRAGNSLNTGWSHREGQLHACPANHTSSWIGYAGFGQLLRESLDRDTFPRVSLPWALWRGHSFGFYLNFRK